MGRKCEYSKPESYDITFKIINWRWGFLGIQKRKGHNSHKETTRYKNCWTQVEKLGRVPQSFLFGDLEPVKPEIVNVTYTWTGNRNG